MKQGDDDYYGFKGRVITFLLLGQIFVFLLQLVAPLFEGSFIFPQNINSGLQEIDFLLVLSLHLLHSLLESHDLLEMLLLISGKPQAFTSSLEALNLVSDLFGQLLSK